MLDGHAQHHFAGSRELDGVAEHVQQHLPKTALIAEQHLGHGGSDMAGELDALLRRADREQLGGIADGFTRVELGAFEIEPPRLDLREVEDVVDDRRAVIVAADLTVAR